ncbi:MAG: OmpA family protein [Bdellovibrionota bacterium]
MLFIALAPERVWAQGTALFQLEHFEPLPTQEINLLNTARSDVLPHLYPSAGLVLHFADNPLVQLDPGGGPDQKLINYALRADLWASVGLFERGELGIVVPATPYQNGADLTQLGLPGQDAGGFSLSDLRVVGKLRFFKPENLYGFGLGFQTTLYVPIQKDQTFTSSERLRVEPRLIVDWGYKDWVALALNAAYQKRPRAAAVNFVSDDVVRWALALETATGVENLRAFGLFFGDIQTATNIDFTNPLANRDDGKGSPAEALLGARYNFRDRWTFELGAGTGLSRGVGAPDWRVVSGVGYSFDQLVLGPTDEDGDGLLYGFFERADRCPEVPEDADGFEDGDGCPEEDNDKDGILDRADYCPLAKEDEDDFNDTDGCPDPDNDRDGILDAQDECPFDPENVDGLEDWDGCPEEEPEYQILGVDTVSQKKIRFAPGSAVLDPESFEVLDEIAEILLDDPTILKIEIGGHTDSQGDAAYNLRLSHARAQAVRMYLIGRGLSRDRITAKGYGEAKPVADNKTLQGRMMNRRVEFKALTVEQKPVEPEAGEEP